jgi:hypothetical protein
VTVVEFGDDVAPLTLEYGVLEGQVVLGLNGWLDAVTNTSPVLTLEDEQTFQATLAALPAPFTSLTFVNLERVIPVIEEAVAAFSGGGVIDADPACAEFESQEAAQAAYDESFENYMLDLDWDGEACEDHFTAATPAGAPDGSVNVLSFGAVTSVDNGAMVTSAVLLIGA